MHVAELGDGEAVQAGGQARRSARRPGARPRCAAHSGSPRRWRTGRARRPPARWPPPRHADCRRPAARARPRRAAKAAAARASRSRVSTSSDEKRPMATRPIRLATWTRRPRPAARRRPKPSGTVSAESARTASSAADHGAPRSGTSRQPIQAWRRSETRGRSIGRMWARPSRLSTASGVVGMLPTGVPPWQQWRRRCHLTQVLPPTQSVGPELYPTTRSRRQAMETFRSFVACAALCAVGVAVGTAASARGARLGQGPAEDRDGHEDGAGAGVPDSDAGRPAADQEVQAAARLQGRDLGLGRARRARDPRGPQGHDRRQHPVRRQQGLRVPAAASASPRSSSTSCRWRPASRSTARATCTSRPTRRSTATTTSRTSSTTRASRKVIYDKLPGGGDHSWKFLRIKDDKLYFPIGAPCNICDPGEYAKIYRMNLDGTRRRDDRLGRAQHRRLRLRPEDRRPLVHRQRPRLVQRGAAERRAERRHASRASSTSASRTATRATSPIRSSAGASRATTT